MLPQVVKANSHSVTGLMRTDSRHLVSMLILPCKVNKQLMKKKRKRSKNNYSNNNSNNSNNNRNNLKVDSHPAERAVFSSERKI
jgi:hypothetical protein